MRNKPTIFGIIVDHDQKRILWHGPQQAYEEKAFALAAQILRLDDPDSVAGSYVEISAALYRKMGAENIDTSHNSESYRTYAACSN